ncbi:hypothetical protein ACQW5G_04035 [Fructilactobacillus sp. Tb1]|uniref:hypothetical protein n=1 Tax=Fructilactobacillus sp. Tb1 TaxID=3422304 RepID=UPI003D2B09C0
MNNNNVLVFTKFNQTPDKNDIWETWSEKEGIYYSDFRADRPAFDSKHNAFLCSDDSSGLISGHVVKLFNHVSRETFAHHYSITKGFLFIENFSVNTGDSVFEIRLKNSDSDWQAICGNAFRIIKVDVKNGGPRIKVPISLELDALQEFFDIRYSGLLFINNLTGARQVVTNDNLILNIDAFTNKLTPSIEYGSTCTSFAERVDNLKRFENRYYTYDSDLKRI